MAARSVSEASSAAMLSSRLLGKRETPNARSSASLRLPGSSVRGAGRRSPRSIPASPAAMIAPGTRYGFGCRVDGLQLRIRATSSATERACDEAQSRFAVLVAPAGEGAGPLMRLDSLIRQGARAGDAYQCGELLKHPSQEGLTVAGEPQQPASYWRRCSCACRSRG